MTTKTHSVAAAAAGAALALCAIVPGHDVAVVWFVAALPLLASLAALALQRATWSRDLLAVLLFEILILIFVPRLYIHVRAQHDAGRVLELAQQLRIGEARALVYQVLSISPNATWKGNSLQLAAEDLEGIASEIEKRVARRLPDDATRTDRLNRARDLAMLGRTKEALDVLGVDASADASNLRGTIHEARGEWSKARGWFEKARLAWREQEDSAERLNGLTQAVTGVAYCERKLGRLREAEVAWRERLELSPPELLAESHFLLAQFYEDTQQAQKARFHVQEAMRLAPDRYAQQGRRLLDKLVTSHFGCLGVFRAESSPATPFGAATIEKQ